MFNKDSGKATLAHATDKLMKIYSESKVRLSSDIRIEIDHYINTEFMENGKINVFQFEIFMKTILKITDFIYNKFKKNVDSVMNNSASVSTNIEDFNLVYNDDSRVVGVPLQYMTKHIIKDRGFIEKLRPKLEAYVTSGGKSNVDVVKEVKAYVSIEMSMSMQNNDLIKDALHYFDELNGDDLVKLMLKFLNEQPSPTVQDNVDKLLNELNDEATNNSGDNVKFDVSELDIPKLVSPMKEFEDDNDGDIFNKESGVFFSLIGNEEYYEKEKAINSMKSVKAWKESFDNDLDKKDTYSTGANILRYYTGTGSSYLNKELRTIMEEDDRKFSYDSLGEKLKRFLDYWKTDSPVMENSFWVYRNAGVPDIEKYKVGDNFIDGGALSTSIKSNISFGAASKPKFKIFVPKGSRVFRIL